MNKKIQDNPHYKFSSQIKSIKIYLPDFKFRKDDKEKDKSIYDAFIGRDIISQKLRNWLTRDAKSGSYLITGYRGMGKTSVVNRVIDEITRKPEQKAENAYYISVGLLFISFLLLFEFTQFNKQTHLFCFLGFLLSSCFFAYVLYQKEYFKIKFCQDLQKYQKRFLFYPKAIISKLRIKDYRDRLFSRLRINVNLGHEVLNERDILCLITSCIKDEYRDFVKSRHSTPLISYTTFFVVIFISWLLSSVMIDIVTKLSNEIQNYYQIFFTVINNWIRQLYHTSWGSISFPIAAFLVSFLVVNAIKRFICRHMVFYSTPYKTLDRLNNLCERISASINEDSDQKGLSNGVINVSLFKRRYKVYSVANVREIESELIDIIKTINEKGPRWARAQFIIVFDELDKIDPQTNETKEPRKDNEDIPEFKNAVSGFPEGTASRERRQNVLRLLANMKLFISTAQAKFVFISGRELYDASLADLSDREFAISSIFNGILNVDSFLSPERGQNDICSMTEQYIAKMLIPTAFLKEKIYENALEDIALKEEIPSLRWYFEYLVKIHITENSNMDEGKSTEYLIKDIEHTILFLHYFSVYLSHVSNGSPKKIVMYFEKYVKTVFDTLRPEEWDDDILLGKPLNKDRHKRQCVLYFDENSQKK